MSDQASESFQDPGEDVDTNQAEVDQFKRWAILSRRAPEKCSTGFTYAYWTSYVTNDKSTKWLL